MHEINILDLVLAASPVVKAVMGLLLFLSLLGWFLIFRLSGKISGSIRDDEAFQEWFWQGNSLARHFQAVSTDPDKDGLAYIFFVGYQEFAKLQKLSTDPSEILSSTERQLKVALGKQQSHLESGLATLASIASVSPYIGLFGTVWGIMTAFIGLGAMQSVSLATVAPAISEALIATAIGLFAAIPASLAFNHFSAKSAWVYESRALFCEECVGLMLKEFLGRKEIA